ncbi:MAG: hypothetical protein Q8L40_10075 [Burkholderiales bacterium]|nr:hypothetical protein [Burkholderiales bacterium]MDP2239338.1 hypothetical protein [Burkholderiales bacterium]
METLYKWRVQEKDKRGRMRWRMVRTPMTEETARFWAANNDKIIERIDAPVASLRTSRPVPASRAVYRNS